MLAKALWPKSIGCTFQRIQFTPDLLPVRRHRPLDLQPEDRRSSSSGRARSSRRSCSPTRSTAPRPRRSRRCSSAWRSARRRRRRHPPDAAPRSWSWPPRTRSSTRARSRCRRPSSTASCCACASATRQPVEEIVILDEQKRTHPHRRDPPRCSASRSCASCRRRVKEIYVDQVVSEYIVRAGHRHPRAPGRLPGRVAARLAACTAPRRRWPRSTAATTSSPTTSRRSPSPPSPTASSSRARPACARSIPMRSCGRCSPRCRSASRRERPALARLGRPSPTDGHARTAAPLRLPWHGAGRRRLQHGDQFPLLPRLSARGAPPRLVVLRAPGAARRARRATTCSIRAPRSARCSRRSTGSTTRRAGRSHGSSCGTSRTCRPAFPAA